MEDGSGIRAAPASRVLRCAAGAWPGVDVLPYAPDGEGFAGVTRRLLARPADAAFETRWFEVAPGGHTRHERHAHVHVVACLLGRGRVRLGDATHELGPGDVVIVGPREPHRFDNPYGEPFGFLCIVDQQRDRPVPVGE